MIPESFEPGAELIGVRPFVVCAFDKRTPITLPGRKLSAIDAAAKVLGEEGRPMNCQEMIDGMAAKGYWQSPLPQDPSGHPLCFDLARAEGPGRRGRFVKAQRGRFERAR
jgi:hypothetical protein